jgi:hypothetical protein
MNRYKAWTYGVLAGAAVAIGELATGWTANLGVLAWAPLLGLFAAAVALYIAMIFACLRDRQLRPAWPETGTALAHAGHMVRWCGLFAVGAAVLLFANCSGVLTPATTTAATSAHIDPQSFIGPALLLELPLLLSLLLPAVLATLTIWRPSKARLYARLVTVSLFVFPVVAVATIVGGLAVSLAASGEFGPASVGAAAAGAGAVITSGVSLLAIALYVPYARQIQRAVNSMTLTATATADRR